MLGPWDGSVSTGTYRQPARRTARFAGVPRSLGVGHGERVFTSSSQRRAVRHGPTGPSPEAERPCRGTRRTGGLLVAHQDPQVLVWNSGRAADTVRDGPARRRRAGRRKR